MNDPSDPSIRPDRNRANLQPEHGLHYDQLVASVEDYAIFTMNPDGMILDWNRGAERLKGYSADEIVGQHFSKFYSAEEKAESLPDRELEIVREQGRFEVEGWRYRKDGTRFWASVTITAIRDAEDRPLRFLKIIRDLTERKASEESLRQSEERFRLLLESVDDYAIFMLDSEGHVASWNAGARRIKRFEESEILGKHFSVFYPKEAITIGLPGVLLRRALETGRVEDDGWRIRKDGSRFWANVVITALHAPGGELRGFAKITRDLSEKRQIEQLREMGRRKDAFLATLAHELRNPLAPMLPGIDLILRSPNDPDRVAALAHMLKRQVEQMTHLIDDLLDMARITAGKIVLKKSRFSLSALLKGAEEAVSPMVQRMNQQLVMELPSGDRQVEGDLHRLTQIVTNLLSNASKYTPAGGHVSVTAAVDSGDLVRISVADDGIGIPPVLQSSIFELFDQGVNGSPEGLGIGLTIVRTLAELHGGEVAVRSAGEGQGSEFILTLPILCEASAGVDTSPQEGNVYLAPNPSRVLVADDGRSAADVLCLFLQLEGLEAVAAYDGQQAVDLASSFAPSLVFLDLGMPKLDGFEAARRIRQMRPSVVLVALSGWGSEEDKLRSARAGFDLHLVKPVKPDDVREVLSRYLPRVERPVE